jgi:hypothetical protein
MSYPTLPPDFVYLGLGGTFKTGGFGFNCMVSYNSSEWNRSPMAGGTNTRLHYCAHKDSEIVKLNTPPLMSHTALPPLPPDHVYLGQGGDFCVGEEDFTGYTYRSGTIWILNTECRGLSKKLHYCAHKDSEIVKLNTSAPAPIAAAQPTQFIVWSDGRGEPTKIHASRDTADAEAQRLAAKHPTMMFSVCEIVARYKATVTVNKL